MEQIKNNNLLKNTTIAAMLMVVVTVLYFTGLLIKNFYYVNFIDDQVKGIATQQIPAEKISLFESELKPIFGDPIGLEIESLNLELDLEQVGVDSDGVMETPKEWNNAGWYYKAAQPGEIGNLIVNGHYDNRYGGPAAFYKLKQAKEGDIVEIKDSYGRLFNYRVIELQYVDVNDPNRLKVLEDQEGKSTLTLITCGGVYIQGSGYNKRLVVKAELLN